MGKALYNSGHYNDAMIYLHQALVFNAAAWYSMQLIGLCFRKLENYDMAIKWMKNAMAANDFDCDKSYLTEKITKWTLKSGDIEAAIRFAHDQFTKQPKDVSIIDLYVDVLTLGRRYEQIYTLLGDISGIVSSNGARSLLADVLLHGWKVRKVLPLVLQSPLCNDELLAACKSFPTDIKDGLGSKAGHELFQAAELRYVYFNQIDEAVLSWENLGKNEDNRDLWHDVAHRLGQIYFSRAVLAKNTGTNYDPWIAKLRDLSKLESRPGMIYRIYNNRIPLLLGHWVRDFEDVLENEWKPYFRTSVLEALKLLTDEDPSNDLDGYDLLAQVLELAGDSQNAAIAFGVVVQPLQALALQRTNIPNQGEDSRSKLKEDEFFYSCAGECDTKKTDYRELHMCRVCFNTAFCETCIKLVKNNQLPFNKCNPAHSFVQAFPIPDEIQDTVAQLLYGPAEFRIKWVEKLRKQWKK